MRPATLRSSQTLKIAETSRKPNINKKAEMTAGSTNHQVKVASANRGEATSPGSLDTPDWSALRTGVTLWGNAIGGNQGGDGVRDQKSDVSGLNASRGMS